MTTSSGLQKLPHRLRSAKFATGGLGEELFVGKLLQLLLGIWLKPHEYLVDTLVEEHDHKRDALGDALHQLLQRVKSLVLSLKRDLFLFASNKLKI
ncbi:hypothetical protein HYQ46_001980 [Verticillium longisporum]|nr:hypothetical protein HYQ46_001980 [Verticillium longisporum]